VSQETRGNIDANKRALGFARFTLPERNASMRRTLLLIVAAVAIPIAAYAAVFNDRDGVRVNHLRFKNGATISGTTDKNLTRAEMHAANFFPVNTSAPGGATLDIDIGNDVALDSLDLGSTWRFTIVTGGSAMTVTAGASGITTVTKQDLGAGSTCEDAGDTIACTAYATTKVLCLTYCAD